MRKWHGHPKAMHLLRFPLETDEILWTLCYPMISCSPVQSYEPLGGPGNPLNESKIWTYPTYCNPPVCCWNTSITSPSSISNWKRTNPGLSQLQKKKHWNKIFFYTKLVFQTINHESQVDNTSHPTIVQQSLVWRMVQFPQRTIHSSNRQGLSWTRTWYMQMTKLHINITDMGYNLQVFYNTLLTPDGVSVSLIGCPSNRNRIEPIFTP